IVRFSAGTCCRSFPVPPAAARCRSGRFASTSRRSGPGRACWSCPRRACPPALTASQSAAICNDVNAWLNVAYNEYTPRFNATLSADETEAGSTKLGTDLSNFDNELQSINSDALLNGPPGQPLAIQAVAADCNAYGVTIRTPGPDGGAIIPNSAGM